MNAKFLKFPWAAFVVVLLLGCGDTPVEPPDVPVATTMVAASTTALEGVAGSGHALEVRVTDAKGHPVSGVSVSWKIASGGGSLSASVSATNASGIASANWNLGAFANEQKVTAESNRLPSVSFVGQVPTATLTVTPVETKLWPGDEVQLNAVVRDAAGTVLEGATPNWSTDRPAVATVAENGMLSAIGIGTATVKATFRGIQAETSTTVLPIVRLRVWSLDGTDVHGEELTVEWASASQTAPVVAQSPYGEAVLRLDESVPESTSVRINVDAENTGSRRYHPVVIETMGGELPTEIKVGLVPLRFTIPFGCFAGQTVDVSARAVLTRADEHGSFYYSDPNVPEVFGLSSEVLPIKVAINLTDGATASDADAVWAAIQGLEECIWPGVAGTLYQRVDPAELTGNGLRVNFDFDLGKSLGEATGKPDVTGGKIDFGTAPSVRSWDNTSYLFPSHVYHETIHTLGFHHSTGEYSSLMGSQEYTGLTAYDVAYIRLMQLAYELRKAHDIPAENFFSAAARGEEFFGR